MSRRTKLLILGLFLVLLAIPMVYVIMTWTAPENPLRFRIEEVTGMEDHKVRDGWVKARICVENITDVPICLILAEAPTGPGSGNVYCEIKCPAPFGSGWYLVPARGSIECIGDLNIYRVRKKQFQNGTMMRYIWLSKTQAATTKVSRWLNAKTPARLRRHIPWATPRTNKTIIPPLTSIP